jgi:hypothetical protein
MAWRFKSCGVSLSPLEWLQTFWSTAVDTSWNMMAHGDTREGKWRGNWRMQWVASTPHATSEHGVSSITTADAHTSAASSPLNWRPPQSKRTHPFRRKTKSGFGACAITFQTQSTTRQVDMIRLDYMSRIAAQCHVFFHLQLIIMGIFLSITSNFPQPWLPTPIYKIRW